MADKIMQRIREHLEHYQSHFNNEWVGIFLQGSQNYGLDYEGSDVDTKIIVLPKFEDIVLNRQPLSTTSVLPNNEHLDVKDIRLMFDCFKKQNINFLEILFTKYYILNPAYEHLFRPVIDAREAIAHYNNFAAVGCMRGMVHEKRKMLTKPHPSAQDVVSRYGYDGKQLHHMERVLEFFRRYINDVPYGECLVSEQRGYLISLKKQALALDQAVQRGDEVVSLIDQAADAYLADHSLSVNSDVDSMLKHTLTEIVRACFIKECRVYEPQVIDAVFVSIWDGGSAAVQSNCKVDLRTNEVFNIEVVDTSGIALSSCDEEYVLVGNERYEVRETNGVHYLVEDEL